MLWRMGEGHKKIKNEKRKDACETNAATGNRKRKRSLTGAKC